MKWMLMMIWKWLGLVIYMNIMKGRVNFGEWQYKIKGVEACQIRVWIKKQALKEWHQTLDFVIARFTNYWRDTQLRGRFFNHYQNKNSKSLSPSKWGYYEEYILYLVQFWWIQKLSKKKRIKSVIHIDDEIDQEGPT